MTIPMTLVFNDHMTITAVAGTADYMDFTIRAVSFSGGAGGIGNSQQGEGFREMGGVAAQGSGYVGMPGPAHQGDDQVA